MYVSMIVSIYVFLYMSMFASIDVSRPSLFIMSSMMKSVVVRKEVSLWGKKQSVQAAHLNRIRSASTNCHSIYLGYFP